MLVKFEFNPILQAGRAKILSLTLAGKLFKDMYFRKDKSLVNF